MIGGVFWTKFELFLTKIRIPNFEIQSLGWAKRKGVGGKEFLPALAFRLQFFSTAAEFRASKTGTPPFDLFLKMIYYDYSMKPNQPQKTNSTVFLSSKEEFESFKKETQEIKIVQDMIRKEQSTKVPNINPATEINYYKI